jgi:hypothetical protein
MPGQGSLQLLQRGWVLGTPGLFGAYLRLASRAVEFDVLIAEEPVGRFVPPVVAAAFTARRTLLPAPRRQMPLGPFFANCHADIVARGLREVS